MWPRIPGRRGGAMLLGNPLILANEAPGQRSNCAIRAEHEGEPARRENQSRRPADADDPTTAPAITSLGKCPSTDPAKGDDDA